MVKFLNKKYRFHFLALFAILLCIGNSAYSAIITSTQTGNWNATSTWVGGVVPVATDNVVISAGHVVDISNNTTCTDLTINGTINFTTNSRTLTVSGNLTMSGTSSINGTNATRILNVTGSYTVSSGATSDIAGVTIAIGGTTNIDGTLNFSSTTGTKTFSNDISIGGSGSITFSAAETIDLSGAGTDMTLNPGCSIDGGATGVINIGGGLIVASGGTSNLNRMTVNVSGASTINGVLSFNNTAGAKTFNGDVTVSSTGAINFQVAETFTLSGASTDLILDPGCMIDGTATGTITVGGNLIVNSGGTVTLDVVTLTVAGSTDINGTLDITSTTGNKTFNGDVVIDGTFQNNINEAITFGGNVTNNGTFTAGTGTYTFSGAGKSLSGTTGSMIFSAGTVNGIYSNDLTSLTFNGNLTGTGELIQSAGANLRLGGTSTITTLTATASGNTISFISAANQTLKGTTYENLEIDKSGFTGTLGAATTINGDLTVLAGTLADGGYQITGNPSGSLTLSSGAVLSLGVAATATTFPTNFIAGNISLDPNSTVIYNSNQAQTISDLVSYGNLTLNATAAVTKSLSGGITVSGTLTIGANNTLNDGGFTITCNGNIVHSGISTGGGILLLSGGSVVHAISGGAATFGKLELSDNFGATWTGTGITTMNSDLTITSGTMTFNAFGTSFTNTGVTRISGTLVINNTGGTKTFNDVVINVGGIWNATVSEPVTITGNLQNDGTLNANTGIYSLSGITKTISGSSAVSIPNLTISGSYTNNGTINSSTAIAGSGTLTQGASSILTIGGTIAAVTTLVATTNPNTVKYNSTSAGQTIKGTTYHHLVFENSGQVATLGAATIVNGDLTVTSGTCRLAAIDLQVLGTISISGILLDNNAGGNNLFNNIIVNAGGLWNNTAVAPYTISGDLQNDGAFTASTGVYTFTGATKTLTGTISIPTAVINGTYTNNGTFTVGTSLSGAGTLTQGNNAYLYLGGTATITNLNATAFGNTVNYNSTAANQTLITTTYRNLTIDKTGRIASLAAPVTINGNLVLTNGTLDDAGFQITGNATYSFSMAAGTTLTLGTAAAGTTFPTGFLTANLALNSTSTVNYNSNVAQIISASPAYGNLTLTATVATTKTISNAATVNGTLTIGANNTLADGGYTLTAKGNVTNNGVHSGAGKIYFNGGSATHIINGASPTWGNFELNDAQGANWSATGTTTVSGDLTVTSGILTAGVFNTALNVNGSTIVTGTLSITSATGTKSFNNIIVNNGGTFDVIVVEAFAVTGSIQNDGLLNSNTGVYTLSGAGKTISGVYAVSIPSATITGSYTNNGIFNVNTALAGTGSLTQGLNSVLNLGGTIAAGLAVNFSGSANTVSYNGTSGAQTVRSLTYHHLVIDKSGQTGTLGGAITVNGDLSILAGTLDVSATNYAVTVKGDYNITAGTFNPRAGTVTFSSTTAPQTISGILSFRNITINNTAGDVSLSAPISIDGTLTLTSGKLITGGNSITFTSTATNPVETSNSRIIGTSVMASRAVGAGALPTFLGVAIAAGADNIGNVTFTRVTGAAGIISVGANSGIACNWDITVGTQPAAGRNVTFTWLSDLDNGNSFSAANLGEVWKKEAAPEWMRVGAAADVSGSNPRSISVTTTSFSKWTVSSGSKPLPVELISFEANCSNTFVNLDWITASETNNDYFIIEKSNDGINFETIGYEEGMGTINTNSNYHFIDYKPFVGINYYRLKQVDFNGDFAYSDVVVVNYCTTTAITHLSVSQTSSEVVVNACATVTNGTALLRIFDLSGKLILENDITNEIISNSTVQISKSGLNTGLFIVSLQIGGAQESEKIVLY